MKTPDDIEAIEGPRFGRWLRDVKPVWPNCVVSAQDAQMYCQLRQFLMQRMSEAELMFSQKP
jgi:hypothetical protein